MPQVSVILPTYNRAKFLAEAIESICAQEFDDWELIVVDDGSTDETSELIPALATKVSQPTRYFHQRNQGAHAARNRGLEHARGRYVAFLDSDDLWLPHHLRDCVAALEANANVDWVYGASRIVDYATERVEVENTLCRSVQPPSFFHLCQPKCGKLNILDGALAIDFALSGLRLRCGLQNSVFRRPVFDSMKLPAYRVGEDRAFVVMALLKSVRIGFLESVHTIYRVHDGNVSMSAQGQHIEHRIGAVTELIRAYEHLGQFLAGDRKRQRMLDRTVSQMYFWQLGYSLLWLGGRQEEAFDAFRRAIELWPSNWRYWKTYSSCRLRTQWRRLSHSAAASLSSLQSSPIESIKSKRVEANDGTIDR